MSFPFSFSSLFSCFQFLVMHGQWEELRESLVSDWAALPVWWCVLFVAL